MLIVGNELSSSYRRIKAASLLIIISTKNCIQLEYNGKELTWLKLIILIKKLNSVKWFLFIISSWYGKERMCKNNFARFSFISWSQESNHHYYSYFTICFSWLWLNEMHEDSIKNCCSLPEYHVHYISLRNDTTLIKSISLNISAEI